MGVLSGLMPEKVFENFEMLCSVSHGSGNTKQISDLIVAWAKERGFAVRQDAANNVVIRKEASPGYEQAPPVILQDHIDMVCASEPDCGIDMRHDGLNLVIDRDWIKAKGTSLGGDNGIAVAITMAILDDAALRHPRIEAVFTTDEETGMDGAMALDASDLTAKNMINLDSEKEGCFARAGVLLRHDRRPQGRTFRRRDRQGSRQRDRTDGPLPLAGETGDRTEALPPYRWELYQRDPALLHRDCHAAAGEG